MRRLIVKTGSLSIALALAAISLPAMAQESQPPATAPAADEMRPNGHETPPVFRLPPQVREEWLAECRRRISWHAPHRHWHDHHKSWHTRDTASDSASSRDVCESYLDDYYAYYANDFANYVRYAQAGYAYPYPAYGPVYGSAYGPTHGYSSPYCRKEPDCSETVEYEEVPMRPAARRIPKRTKTVPDKRIPKN